MTHPTALLLTLLIIAAAALITAGVGKLLRAAAELRGVEPDTGEYENHE